MAIFPAMSKKGVFLTLISLVLVAGFTILFSPSHEILTEDLSALEYIDRVNEFVQDLETIYLIQSQDASSTHAILTLIEYMENQNNFLVSFEPAFTEVMRYGTLGGSPFASMDGNSYEEKINQLITLGDATYHTKSSAVITSIVAFQQDPWSLIVESTLSMSINSSVASWNKDITVRSFIPITRFKDPYRLINSNGAIDSRINRSEDDPLKLNLSILQRHMQYGTFTHFEESRAPSFIMRFTNTSLSSSCCGIESVLDRNDLSIPDQMESYSDYLFFNHSYLGKCTELYNITGLPGYQDLKLDIFHVSLYNLSPSNYKQSC